MSGKYYSCSHCFAYFTKEAADYLRGLCPSCSGEVTETKTRYDIHDPWEFPPMTERQAKKLSTI